MEESLPTMATPLENVVATKPSGGMDEGSIPSSSVRGLRPTSRSGRPSYRCLSRKSATGTSFPVQKYSSRRSVRTASRIGRLTTPCGAFVSAAEAHTIVKRGSPSSTSAIGPWDGAGSDLTGLSAGFATHIAVAAAARRTFRASPPARTAQARPALTAQSPPPGRQPPPWPSPPRPPPSLRCWMRRRAGSGACPRSGCPPCRS